VSPARTWVCHATKPSDARIAKNESLPAYPPLGSVSWPVPTKINPSQGVCRVVFQMPARSNRREIGVADHRARHTSDPVAASTATTAPRPNFPVPNSSLGLIANTMLLSTGIAPLQTPSTGTGRPVSRGET